MSQHDAETLEMPKGDEGTGRRRSPIIGRRLGPYEVLAQVGKGGMGVVYRAYDTALQREVALKLIPPQYADDDRKLRRFLREARSSAALSHPAIVPIYFAGVEDGLAFIAMEFVPGKPLSELMDELEEPLAPRHALEIARAVAEGLEHAHERGIVHRDIKADNLMVQPDGRVRIMDFGLARQNLLTGSKITESGIYLGTPEYSSPEQIETKELDGRSDLYSLGVVLYEMLTGDVPFTAETPYQLFHQILHDDPKPVSEVNPLVPASFDGVVDRLLARAPENRYASAGEFIEDCDKLQQLLDGTAELVEQPEDGVVAQVELPRPRRPSSQSAGHTRSPSLAIDGRPAVSMLLGMLVTLVVGLGLVLAVVLSGDDQNSDPAARNYTTGGGPGAGGQEDPAGASNLNPALPIERPVVVVNNFANRNGSGVFSWLELGIADQLIITLAQSPHLDVISRDRVTDTVQALEAAGKPSDYAAVARALGAHVVIHGSFIVSGGNLRIMAQITDFVQGRTVDGLSVTGPEPKLLMLIDDLAGRVHDKLRALYFREGVDQPATATEPEPNVLKSSYAATDLEALTEMLESARAQLAEAEARPQDAWLEPLVDLPPISPDWPRNWSLPGPELQVTSPQTDRTGPDEDHQQFFAAAGKNGAELRRLDALLARLQPRGQRLTEAGRKWRERLRSTIAQYRRTRATPGAPPDGPQTSGVVSAAITDTPAAKGQTNTQATWRDLPDEEKAALSKANRCYMMALEHEAKASAKNATAGERRAAWRAALDCCVAALEHEPRYAPALSKLSALIDQAEQVLGVKGPRVRPRMMRDAKGNLHLRRARSGDRRDSQQHDTGKRAANKR